MTPYAKPRDSLASLAVHWPELIPYFEEMDMDYCCQGNTPLEDMCNQANLPVRRVLKDCNKIIIDNGEQAVHWENASPGKVVEYIRDHFNRGHQQAFEQLIPLADAVLAEESERLPELVPRLYQMIRWLVDDFAPHLHREECLIFPLAYKLQSATAQTIKPGLHALLEPLEQMEQEHLMAANLLNELKSITSNYCPPIDSGPAYRELCDVLRGLDSTLRRHMHLENNILYPKLRQLNRLVAAG